MKPLIISTACTIFLICLWGAFYIHSGNILNDFSHFLAEETYQNISQNDWEAAETSVKSLSKQWEKHKALFYMLSNHMVIRETDIAFAKLNELVKNHERADAYTEIATINELFLSIRQAEAFTIDNIL